MKTKTIIKLISIITIPILFMSLLPPPVINGDYVIIGWNDLGMHCANKDFDSIVILPPYNNMRAQVIQRGSGNQHPQVVDAGYTVEYSIPGNTYSVGKTNFWTYDSLLFGVNLPDNIGLAGAGLTGNLDQHNGYFQVEGIPVTPYTDANLNTEDPYQLALLQLFDNNYQLLAETSPVIPVSGEINCVSSGCHTSQQDILDRHEHEGGFNPNNLPILCSSCHEDVALGMPGQPGLGSLSFVMHDRHKEYTNDCYKCHPGPNTQCLRGTMYASGMSCQDCHGSMTQVAQSIQNGRQPWLEEPSCGDCHGQQYAEEPGKLFRESKGHGGLYCSACHGSPHVILPSTNDRDNVQNIAIQGHAGTLDDCTVCHGTIPNGAGPHGYNPGSLSNDATLSDLQVEGTTIPGFDPATLTYDYIVAEGTIIVPVTTATPNDPAAVVVITPATSIPGTTTILVTAEDGTTTLTYLVNFNFSTVQQFVEGFETGVPHDYYSGPLYLSTGTWEGSNVKSSETSYAGQQSIELKKETTSSLVTPSFDGIGTISFYYNGSEKRKARFKVQKNVNNGSWVTLSTEYFRRGSWSHFSYTVDDPASNQKIRILVQGQRNLLFIDEFSVSANQVAGPYSPQGDLTQSELNSSFKSDALNADQTDISIYAFRKDIFLQPLSGNPGNCTVDIIDLSGKVVERFEADLSSYSRTTLNTEAGCYIIRVSSPTKSWTRKIIIQ